MYICIDGRMSFHQGNNIMEEKEFYLLSRKKKKKRNLKCTCKRKRKQKAFVQLYVCSVL